MHPANGLPHRLGRARCSPHAAGPQAGQIVTIEIGIVQQRDVHHRDAIEGGAALFDNRRQRAFGIETLGGKHQRAAMGNRGECAEHQAVTVKKGNRQADTVFFGKALALANEKPVIEQPVMGKKRALWASRRTGRVLKPARLIARHPQLQRRGLSARGTVLQCRKIRPVQRAFRGLVTEIDQPLHMRKISLHSRERIDNGICPKIPRRNDDRRFGIAENIFGLALSQSRVDRDDDSSKTNRAVVSDQPFGAIRAPDRHMISGIDPERHKRSCDRVGRLVKLRIAVSLPLKNADDRVAVRKACGSIAQCGANGKIEKWLVRDTRRVR
jgi:hypothetical protein